MIVVGDAPQDRPEQRAGRQVEWPPRLPGQGRRIGGPRPDVDRRAQAGPDPLARDSVDRLEGGAQRLVPRGDRVEPALQRVRVERAAQP